jgi:hypothetical protein
MLGHHLIVQFLQGTRGAFEALIVNVRQAFAQNGAMTGLCGNLVHSPTL